MGPMLRRASRAIKFMLETVDVPHWTLWRTDQFIPTLNKLFDELTGGDENIGVVALAGDIKQMYTELDHDSILDALQWLKEEYRTTTRRNHVAVPRFARHGAHKGIAYSDRSFVSFSLDEIIQIVTFDLKNAVFTAGDTVLKQKIGIPMGSPISPILAILVCAHAEFKFIKANTGRKVCGTRYVDDAKFLTTFDKSDSVDWDVANKLLNHVSKTCYHKDLIVELDDNQTHIKMLESIVWWPTSGNRLRAEFWHKNKDFIRDFGIQKFIKFQRADSFATNASKKGVIISTVMRIIHASSHMCEFLKAIPFVFQELNLLGYSLSMIKQVVDRLRKDPLPDGWGSYTWEKVLEIACDEWCRKS
jgi:hypothetical protein